MKIKIAGQMLGHAIQNRTVGDVARDDFQRHDLAFVVDHEVQLKAEKPPHAGLAARCQAVEDFVTLDAAIITDGKLGCIGKVEASLLAAYAVQQDHLRCEQPRYQADETVVMRQIGKAGTMLLADPVVVEHFVMLERREVKQHHDEQHLGLRQLASTPPGRL